jgi:hypothetical protein
MCYKQSEKHRREDERGEPILYRAEQRCETLNMRLEHTLPHPSCERAGPNELLAILKERLQSPWMSL